MDLRKLLNNRNINKDLSLQEPGLSHNVREFGPYQVRTNIERISDGYDGMGNKLRHSIELPDNMQQDEEMANRVAEELDIDPSVVLGIKPGDTWMKGNTDFNQTMGNPEEERFQRLNRLLKK